MRVRLKNQYFDHIANWRDHRWDSNWIERPRLWSSAVALALGEPDSVCDPACGDGAVILTANQIRPIQKAWFGDISHDTIDKLVPKELPFTDFARIVAPAELTLASMPEMDAIVLTEFLEHIEDPDTLLRQAREKARWLVASSPIVPDGNDHTKQHLWAFDMDGYREMLEGAGWKPKVWQIANCEGHPYASGFQIWGCER